jgi:hypothetical protein
MPTEVVENQQATRSVTVSLLRAVAVLSVLALVFQFVTAGQLLSNNKAALALHGDGAIAAHVLFGLTMVAAGIHWRLQHTPWWPTVLAIVMFALSFAQAKLGANGMLWAHVPGAIVLTVGIVWIAAWAFHHDTHRQPPDVGDRL